MKIFRMIGAALVAAVIAFAFSSCEKDGKDVYKDYSQLIVGKWFNFTPEASGFIDFQADGTYKEVGYNNKIGWTESAGSYRFDGNRLINTMSNSKEYSNIVEITREKLIYKAGGNPERPELGEIILYRAKESFDIKGNYTYLNSAVRVVAAAGKTEMKLHEGITFGGKNTISIEAMKDDRIVEQMKSFFADAMFTPNAKLRHTVDGTVMYKDYALDGNNLLFELNKGHKLNATSFPDEDGDRLFIIIPKQEAWVGGLADAIRKENPANVMTDEVVAALEKEFMDTFETFTVVLSLSKTGEYNAAEDVDPYKDYPQLIVGKWFNINPDMSMFVEYNTDGTFSQLGYTNKKEWRDRSGRYEINGNKITGEFLDEANKTNIKVVELTSDKFIFEIEGLKVSSTLYRAKEQFDITGKYSYLNSAVRVVAAAGKTEMKLPEGITFGGKNTISIEAMKDDRIVEQMKSFFADAMFTPNAKLRHTVDGTVMYKDYALDGNNLLFELNKGHKLNATSFPDEDGDRLFIIIPKQEAWVGGLADAIRKENPANVLTDEVVAALEKEFMDTFETFTVVLSLSKTGEYNAADDVDPYKDYPQLIVGKWYSFSPEGSMFHNIDAAGNHITVGYIDKTLGWLDLSGKYRIEGNKLIDSYIAEDGSLFEVSNTIEVSEETLTYIGGTNSSDPTIPGFTAYRVKEQFDITGKYSYLNSAVRVVAAAGKTEMKLPEGITFGGKNTISVEALHGDRIVEQMKSFFADAMFTPNAKLRHTVDGTVMYKDYALDGNNLSFELNKGYKLNATSFPDEDGDRLFIIIPKQEAWVGGLADVIRKENPANVITDEVVAALEKEFMDTFETFTVVLSLSKTGEYNAADDVDPYKDYAEFIVGKWFNFSPDASVFMNFNPDNTFSVIGYYSVIGWMDFSGIYRLDGNTLIHTYPDFEVSDIVEITSNKFIYKAGSHSENLEVGERIQYRVQESFDIKGNYSYLNSVVRVVPAEGKTALQLPEGVTFNGQNYIPVDAMHGDRIIDVMKKFFADATFAADGKLNHTLEGEAKVKNYTLNGNNLVFNLYEGSDTYKVNATSFPDEDGDRLFIIIPKQAAWLGGMVDLVEKENEGLKLNAAQIAALEKEFMDTFETFTVILSLSKK